MLNLRPAISQPDRRATGDLLAKTQALAVFSDTRTGQGVALQRDRGTGWETVSRSTHASRRQRRSPPHGRRTGPHLRRQGLPLEPQRPLGIARPGYAAARMKMHLDKGMHASFWLQPANWYTPGQPAKGTEIDVVEFFGRTSSSSTIGSFVHWYDAANEHRKLGGLFPYADFLRS